MKLRRRQFLHFSAGVVMLPKIARAQAYPTRPITIVVPYPAGGPTDIVARLLADGMRPSLGQPVVIENVGVGSGNIGVGRVARATPDGYTLLVGNNGSNVLNGALYPLPFDLISSFEPITLLTSNPQIIITKKQIPAQTLNELIAWLKINQSRVSVGVAGPVATVSAVHFQNLTSTRFQLISYRGAAPAIQDLVGGQIELMFDQLSNALPQVKSGTVKAYAVAAPHRSPSAPDIPTVDEAGLPHFYGALWHGLWGPKGTPGSIIDKVNTAALQMLADAAVKQRFDDVGQEIVPPDQQGPAALAVYQRAERDKWWPIVKAANLRGE